jgi:transcription antitermination factor NusG
VPAFPRYVLVALDTHWTPVRYCPGVHSLLMNDGKPSIVADTVVEAIRSALDAAKGAAGQEVAWKPGTPCSLASGPLAGHIAVVLSVRRDTAHLSVMLFGGLREVSAPVAWLVERE